METRQRLQDPYRNSSSRTLDDRVCTIPQREYRYPLLDERVVGSPYRYSSSSMQLCLSLPAVVGVISCHVLHRRERNSGRGRVASSRMINFPLPDVKSAAYEISLIEPVQEMGFSGTRCCPRIGRVAHDY